MAKIMVIRCKGCKTSCQVEPFNVNLIESLLNGNEEEARVAEALLSLKMVKVFCQGSGDLVYISI